MVSRFHDGADSIELAFVDGAEILAEPDNSVHAGNSENRHAVERIKSAKNITREEGKVYVFSAVGPATGAAVQGKKFFVSFAPKIACNGFFKTESYVKRIPERAILGAEHLRNPPGLTHSISRPRPIQFASM